MLVLALHGLGLSGRTFEPVAAAAPDLELVGIDLPGYGDRADAGAASLDDMIDAVMKEVVARTSDRWLLAGHSMGGKVATLLTRHLLEIGWFAPSGVLLLAASPPSPEPMDEETRATMLGWAADGPLDAGQARAFVDDNVGAPLPAGLDELATSALRRADPGAWRRWLEEGSREDRAAEAGRLEVPAIIVSGGADGPLGADAQHRLNGPVYPRAEFETLDGAGHLLPLERPREVADLLHRLAAGG